MPARLNTTGQAKWNSARQWRIRRAPKRSRGGAMLTMPRTLPATAIGTRKPRQTALRGLF
jgi:hypothetical protein